MPAETGIGAIRFSLGWAATDAEMCETKDPVELVSVQRSARYGGRLRTDGAVLPAGERTRHRGIVLCGYPCEPDPATQFGED
jgi:hypothetical protein